jgi:hypothetical protein
MESADPSANVRVEAAHCQSDRAQILEVLRKEIKKYTPEKTVEAYRSRILDFKATMKTVFKADKDTAHIIHVHKIVVFCTTNATDISVQNEQQ